jgi:hypothetical protein
MYTGFSTTIKATSFSYYPTPKYRPPLTEAAKDAISRGRQSKKYTGQMTASGISTMKRYIDAILQLSDWQYLDENMYRKAQSFRLGFLTLTIPNNVIIQDYKYANKCLLKPFLRKLRVKFKNLEYVWKLELQESGQIHYHIVVNQWVHWGYYRNYWNNVLYKEGLLEDYKTMYGDYNPNSTDIHKIEEVSNIVGYMEKYMAKNGETIPDCSGQIIGASETIQAFKRYRSDKPIINKAYIEKAIESGELKEFKSDYVTTVTINYKNSEGKNCHSNTTIRTLLYYTDWRLYHEHINYYKSGKWLTDRSDRREANKNKRLRELGLKKLGKQVTLNL